MQPHNYNKPFFDVVFSLGIGFSFGVACIIPDTIFGLLLASSASIGLWFLFQKEGRVLLSFFLVGFAFHLVSMWWIGSTIERFGGFNWIAANALLLLYCGASSIQFVLSACLGLFLSRGTARGIAFLFSWMFFEICFPRLFPWGLGNFFIYANFFVTFAEYVGASGLSFLVLIISWGGYSIIKDFYGNTFYHFRKKNIIISASILLLFITGFFLDEKAKKVESNASSIHALVVQGNLDIHEKGAMSYLEANINTYQNLTREGILQAKEAIDLIIWPETVMNYWTPLMYEHYPELYFDPFPDLEIPLLYGSLAYYLEEGEAREDAKMYNAGIVRIPGGILSLYYAKRVLMPFGEYVPFGDMFPWIRSMVPLQGEFSRGPVASPLSIETSNRNIKVGVLVCYEDLVSGISRDYVNQNADLLVNLTNDAWYGNSPAPYQHDLLARFRAIETRRALIRATNTGFTTLVSSRGEIVESFPLFEKKAGVFQVPLMSGSTFYVRWGDWPLYGVLLILGVILGGPFFFNFKKR
jgi:apolipoprotein N-acyltransferase